MNSHTFPDEITLIIQGLGAKFVAIFRLIYHEFHAWHGEIESALRMAPGRRAFKPGTQAHLAARGESTIGPLYLHHGLLEQTRRQTAHFAPDFAADFFVHLG
jgi:hypothetical protein